MSGNNFIYDGPAELPRFGTSALPRPTSLGTWLIAVSSAALTRGIAFSLIRPIAVGLLFVVTTYAWYAQLLDLESITCPERPILDEVRTQVPGLARNTGAVLGCGIG
jgi:hypothetical protein